MLKKISILFFALFSISHIAFAQIDTLRKVKSYQFIALDKPTQLWTMRQFDQNYLSLYRLYSTQLDKHFSEEASTMIQAFSMLLTLPLSHEEGHRSILTQNNIGSISKPYYNSKGAAYVVGVKDIDLQDLRDNDLPTYIRLHTGGLESDYMISLATERLLTFEDEDYKILRVEYLFRKLTMVSYYFTSAFKFLSPNLEEEADEKKRDIVGHDVYGAVRHIHRPDMPFFRYTDYEDLSAEERNFINRVAFRSLLSILNPQLIGKRNFKISNNIKGNIGFGYLMTPFGDEMDNNIWVMINSKTKLLFQNSVYQNRDKLFYGFSTKLFDYPIGKNYWVSFAANLWNQPLNLDFSTDKSSTGGLVSGMIKYGINNKSNPGHFMTFDLGLQYKTFGFVPEEVILGEAFSFRFGFSYNIVTNNK